MHVLYDIAFAYFAELSLMTEDQHKALNKVDAALREQEVQFSVGLPTYVHSARADKDEDDDGAESPV